jgi:hypothetical protein
MARVSKETGRNTTTVGNILNRPMRNLKEA